MNRKHSNHFQRLLIKITLVTTPLLVTLSDSTKNNQTSASTSMAANAHNISRTLLDSLTS